MAEHDPDHIKSYKMVARLFIRKFNEKYFLLICLSFGICHKSMIIILTNKMNTIKWFKITENKQPNFNLVEISSYQKIECVAGSWWCSNSIIKTEKIGVVTIASAVVLPLSSSSGNIFDLVTVHMLYTHWMCVLVYF